MTSLILLRRHVYNILRGRLLLKFTPGVRSYTVQLQHQGVLCFALPAVEELSIAFSGTAPRCGQFQRTHDSVVTHCIRCGTAPLALYKITCLRFRELLAVMESEVWLTASCTHAWTWSQSAAVLLMAAEVAAAWSGGMLGCCLYTACNGAIPVL